MPGLDYVHGQVEVGGGIVDAQHAVANLIGDLVQAASLIGGCSIVANAELVAGWVGGILVIGGVDGDLELAAQRGHGSGVYDVQGDGARVFGAGAIDGVDPVVGAVAGFRSHELGRGGRGLDRGAVGGQGEERRRRRGHRNAGDVNHVGHGGAGTAKGGADDEVVFLVEPDLQACALRGTGVGFRRYAVNGLHPGGLELALGNAGSELFGGLEGIAPVSGKGASAAGWRRAGRFPGVGDVGDEVVIGEGVMSGQTGLCAVKHIGQHARSAAVDGLIGAGGYPDDGLCDGVGGWRGLGGG